MPVFPIIIVFDDWELAAYRDADDFFEHSGCEEFDFMDGLKLILDASGAVFSFDQASRRFVIRHDEKVSLSELEAMVQTHLQHKLGEQSAELMRRYPQDSIEDAMSFAYESIKKAE